MNIRKHGGSSTVEFAIVVPLLLVVIFAIIEFSIALFNQAVITNAARDGARAGIVYIVDPNDYSRRRVPTSAEIENIVDDYIGNYLMSLGGNSTHVPTIGWIDESGLPVAYSDVDSGDRLTVEVRYRYDFLVLRPLVALTGGAIPGSINQRAESVMRME
jgi:Flp pilus assembly protein TadG